MWTPFKELQSVVDAVLAKPAPGALTQLKQVLRKHKQNFITLLKNPPKNAESRETLRKGISECIHLPGMGYQILSKELVDEAIIISDMFDLNEILAIDLLCTAQQQLLFHPGLNRGLVAILLYYDGRKALVSALRSLVHVRKGFSWAGNYPPEIVDYITLYTNKLMEDGVLLKILDLLECLDLSKELELLHHNRALGGPKHQHQVVEQFQEIRQALADIIFLWTAQTGLPKDPTFKLINHLKSCKIQDEVSGGIDGVNLALEMALLCALDLSLLHRMEDGAELVRNLPLLSDTSFIPALVRELSQCVKPWECSGLQATTQLAWALALTTLRLSPSNLYTDRSVLEEDEMVVETAIDLKVFDFLHTVFLENKTIYKEQFYLQRLHTLITDFLVLMPTKVKELRTRGDETARTVQVYAHEGLEPPASLTHHFEHLLLTVERFYRDNPLGLELALDFWCPTDTTKHSTIYLYGIPSKLGNDQLPTHISLQAGNNQLPTHISLQAAVVTILRLLRERTHLCNWNVESGVVLFKFVRMAGEMLPPTLFVPYLKMLRSLASSPQCSRYAFNMLKENSSNNLSYYNNLRQELPPSTDTVYRHRVYPRGITPQEIQGLQAVLGVTRTVAEYDDCAQVALCENPHWNALNILLGLVSCSVPIPLKAELLLTLAALARSPSTAATLWHSLEASQILTTVPSISSYQPRGVQTELEEIESRNEEFPLTRALLHLMDVLTNLPVPRLLGAGSRTPGFDPYLQFIMNSVFLRFNTRTYKNPGEKWEVANGCLKLLVKFVTQYEPHLEDFVGKQVELQGGGLTQVNPPSGFHLMIALNSKSELIRLVLYIIHEGCQLLDSYSSFPAKEMLESCTLLCLQLIQKALNLQQRFLSLLSGAGSNLLLTGLSKLLLDINPRSGQPDNLLNITK
uniref:Nuclear pore complex protein Nup205 n=1 Tax=Timema monikensis TaxID=170555 RepID=A0A7R9EIP8_9NEOP|nr:unnamed protein product [Timema monikensis]